MNFIKHFLKWMEHVQVDDRLTPHHVSLYITLFHYWNLNHFRNPISISREETMTLSKIGSVNTYSKCLKELHHWHYIRYVPSFNSMRGSKVHMFIFDKGRELLNVKSDTADNKGPEQLNIKNDTADDNGDEKVVRPSINILNNINLLNNTNRVNAHPNENLIFWNDRDQFVAADREQEINSDKERDTRGVGLPGSVEETRSYFKTQKSTAIEAEKFFNYFQSNGWLIGGRTPMKDWQAAARKWIINVGEFNKHSKSNLHVSTDKDYGEPL